LVARPAEGQHAVAQGCLRAQQPLALGQALSALQGELLLPLLGQHDVARTHGCRGSLWELAGRWLGGFECGVLLRLKKGRQENCEGRRRVRCREG